jgi:peroxiredoxin Q/BCP
MSAYRDQHSEFAGADAQVLGVSMDDIETQTKFAESLKTPFPLLSDPEGKAAGAYGVIRELPQGGRIANRVTFIVGKDGKVVKTFEGAEAIDPAGALGACKSGQ